jgi:hypothetical protein
MPANEARSLPSVPATSRPDDPPSLAGGTRGLPVAPRVLRYTCGHYTGAATGIRLTYAMAHEWGGIKAIESACPQCQPPVRRLPAKPCDQWP